ncbi:DUF262 domain-containing protein [Longitalea arenae]|uniref:DUF262 domain-containing protein n=1 Tax=Longitalea arenae TaxID=2812558 RepID=UPI00196776B5|nr:DUF262 domain-containing protein [Longitalea arenae]
MEISEIFENLIKIEPKVMSIDSLFSNEERVKKTNYKPSYQRNYVWDDEKATYFIESILLGTEIPPLIYFRNGDKVEVIDGRQRYETILRFLNNELKLKKKGLQKLDAIGITNKYFKSLDSKYRDFFWDTKLRIIEFSFHSKKYGGDEIEEIVKKEIFKRYNSGITPLKPTEIDKAAYISDDLNSYFKEKLLEDRVLYEDISGLFYFEKSNIEIILKKIRQLLVQHKIPIKYYAVRKDTVVSRFFDLLSSTITEEQIENEFRKFIEKINLLKKFRNILDQNGINYNRLISESLFWAFSVLENENRSIHEINKSTIHKLVKYIGDNIEAFKMERSSFAKELTNRYVIISTFFAEEFGIDFSEYVSNNPEFKAKNKQAVKSSEEIKSFEDLRINKPEPSSIAIEDICRLMSRQRFLIRPPYQRNEVINKKKSSAIIESILIGIKLPPIFVFKRKDDISEVLDGQQRLLSILAFIKKPYLDEKNLERFSEKNGFPLNLKSGILKNLNGRTFEQLDQDQRDKIKNFDLWIIEIKEKNNEHFESIDLFIRLNNKPYPIKEDTFEMWNSYISREIIDTIKAVHKNNKDWFYLRKNNDRMEDENIYTFLIYLHYSINRPDLKDKSVIKDLDIYKSGDKIIFRVKSKAEITKALEAPASKHAFIRACFEFEFVFLHKVRELFSDENNSVSAINQNLDKIFNKENNRRTQQSFYALWHFLYYIPLEVIIENKKSLRKDLVQLFVLMDFVKSKSQFDESVKAFKQKYGNIRSKMPVSVYERIEQLGVVTLSNICEGISGINVSHLSKTSSQNHKDSYTLLKDIKFSGLSVTGIGTGSYQLENIESPLKEIIESKTKIILKKHFDDPNEEKLPVAITEGKWVFGNEVFTFAVRRHGYDPKFVAALIASRLIGSWLKKVSPEMNGRIHLSLKTINKIPIPLLSANDQAPFVNVVDYVINSAELGYRSFFQRILDAMIYELYFKEQVMKAECEVTKYMENLPKIESLDLADDVIFEQHKKFSSPNHPVTAALLRLSNIKEVIEIEGII